jgi:PAS domain S-box-containing protein
MMNKLGEVFEQSTDAVFGIDATGMIRFVNSTFEELLGYSHNQLCGSQCAKVLCGTDILGKAFCGTHCPIPKTVTTRPSISDFDLVIKRADGDKVLVNIGANYIPQQSREDAGLVDVFFTIRRVNPLRMLQRLATAPAEASDTASTQGRIRLTSRETEILGLATRGMKTTQIAHHLSVSTQTIRSHFKNIYPKLGVNSRVEAVIVAMQYKLL